MHPTVPFMIKPILVASAHGIDDIERYWNEPWKFSPYIAAPLLIPDDYVFPVFICTSIIHFRRDCSMFYSILLHLFWGCMYFINDEIAWDSFALFYCCIHAKNSFANSLNAERWTSLLLAFIIFIFVPDFHIITIDKNIQLIIIAHALSHELII